MSDTYHFQVNLGGMLDVLSNHLDSVKVFSQKQIWPFGSRQSTGYDIRQQIILCF